MQVSICPTAHCNCYSECQRYICPSSQVQQFAFLLKLNSVSKALRPQTAQKHRTSQSQPEARWHQSPHRAPSPSSHSPLLAAPSGLRALQLLPHLLPPRWSALLPNSGFFPTSHLCNTSQSSMFYFLKRISFQLPFAAA